MNKRKPLSVGKQVLFTFGTLCAVLLVIGGLFLFSLRSIERSNQLQPSRALDKYVETDAGEIAGATNRFIAKIRIIGDVLVGLTILIALGTGFAVVRVTRRLKGDNETLQNEIQERQYTEQQLRVQTTALDAAANAIVITNHDGTIQSVNPAFTAMTGYTAQEVLGQNLRILKSGKQDEAFYRNLWQTISSGQVWSGELANRRKDGSLYAEEMTITPLRDAGGVIARYIAIKQDITKRKRAAERLQQSEGRMRAISDSVQDAILVMDPEGCITFWNPAAERILGYTSAEAIGQDLHDLIVPVRFHAAHHAAYPAFLETGQGAAVGKTLDLEARRKDGLEIPIQLSLSAFQMKDGWHAVGIIRDTTELKKAEMEIQHQAAFARFNPNPVLELSAGGEITFFNRAAGAMARALGRETPAQMLPPNTAAIVRECLAADAPKTRLETQIGERVISWSFFPVKFKHKVHCYAGDTTERKQAEEALRRSETKFRALYDSTGDAVMLLDKNGFFDCNPATLAMFGCATREEFCLKHPADVSPPMQPGGTDSLTLARQQIATATEKGSHRFEWMHQRADTGVAFPAEVLLSAMELDGKQVFQATVRDITERKRSEESQRLQSAALEAAANAIIITDQSGNIQSVNPAFTALTGYTAQEAVGQNPRILKSG